MKKAFSRGAALILCMICLWLCSACGEQKPYIDILDQFCLALTGEHSRLSSIIAPEYLEQTGLTADSFFDLLLTDADENPVSEASYEIKHAVSLQKDRLKAISEQKNTSQNNHPAPISVKDGYSLEILFHLIRQDGTSEEFTWSVLVLFTDGQWLIDPSNFS